AAIRMPGTRAAASAAISASTRTAIASYASQLIETTARPSLWSRTTPRHRTAAPCPGAPTSASTAAGSMTSCVIQVRMSASGDRWDECDLVAVAERRIGRDVLLVDGDGDSGGDALEPASAAAQDVHQRRGGGVVGQVDLELGGPREIAVLGEQEQPDTHRRSTAS